MQVELRIKNTDLSAIVRSYTDRRLRFALSRFGGRVGRVVVTVSEVIDTTEGFLKSCHINAELAPFGQVAASETDPDLYSAIDRTAGRIGRLLASRLSRGNDETGPTAVNVWEARRKKKAHLSSKRSKRVVQERLPKRGLAKSPGDRPRATAAELRATNRCTRGGSNESGIEGSKY